MKDRNMRVLKVLVTCEETHSKILTILDDNDLDYVISDHTRDPDTAAMISCPLPASGVEPVRSKLGELELSDQVYLVVVDPEMVVPAETNEEDRYSQVEGLGYQGISRSELHSNASDLVPEFTIYSLMTAISAVIATAGVLLESLAVLVGSMVIAPLIGPPMATSVATVIDDGGLFTRTVRYQIAGSAIGMLSATVFALLIRISSFVPADLAVNAVLQFSTHTAPGVLLVVVALSAGVAGALSLSTGAEVGLVGVMIAAALVPPLGVMGVGIAWAEWIIAAGSGMVVLINVVSINLAAIITFWYLGYHPESWLELRRVRSRMLVRVIVLTVAIVLLATLLANLTGAAEMLSAVSRTFASGFDRGILY